MPDIAALIEKLRSRIDDEVEPYTYSDATLKNFVPDALTRISSRYKFTEVLSTTGTGDTRIFTREITDLEETLLLIQLMIIVKEVEKIKADGGTFSMRKNKLAIDNTKQPSNHAETIELLEKKLKDMIREINIKNIDGAVVV